MRYVCLVFLVLGSTAWAGNTAAPPPDKRAVLRQLNCQEDSNDERCRVISKNVCVAQVVGCRQIPEGSTAAEAISGARAAETLANDCCSGNSATCEVLDGAKTAVDWLKNLSAGSEGMNSACSQMQNISTNLKTASWGFVGACAGYRAACLNYVAMATRKRAPANEISSLKQSCSQPAQESSVQAQASSSMQTEQLAAACKGKTDGGTTVGGGTRESNGSKEGGGLGMSSGQVMSMLGSAMQAAMMLAQQQQQDQMMPDMGIVSCDTNPYQAHCPINQEAPNSWNGQEESISGRGGTSAKGSFNLADNNDVMRAQSLARGNPSTPPTVERPQNGGGAFQAGMGQQQPMAPPVPPPPAAVGSRSSTDIMDGFRSGGGYAAINAGLSTAAAGGQGYSAPQYEYERYGADLKRLFPKDEPAPRGLAGAAPTQQQIQSVQVNVWKRITDRLRDRCNAGRLRDCSGEG